MKKKKKTLCLVYHISTKKPPALFLQPLPNLPIILTYPPSPPIINNHYNVQPPIISTPPIIRDSRVFFFSQKNFIVTLYIGYFIGYHDYLLRIILY